MIDWFASKLGLIIFIVVCVGALVGFALMQLNIFDQSVRIGETNALVRIIDSVCEGCTAYYTLEGNWSLSVENNTLVLEGIARHFASDALPVNLRTQRIKILKQNNIVNVSEA